MFDNFTDDELVRRGLVSDEPFARALAERLEMRMRDIEDLESLTKRKTVSKNPNQLELF